MKVLLNNLETDTGAENLHELLLGLDISTAGLAVAVGSKVVRRDLWKDTLLEEGMVITLIRATQGG